MKKTIATLVISIGLLNCSAASALSFDEVDPRISDGSATREFREARNVWLSGGFQNYRFKASQSCFCRGPRNIVIRVQDGRPKRISPKPKFGSWFGPWTVPGMFKVVHGAIKGQAAKLDVVYDPVTGVPKSVWIDRIAGAADDEVSYRISGFRAIAG